MPSTSTTDTAAPAVLLIDDDEALLYSLRRLLHRGGRPVLIASDADQASAQIATREVGVIVSEPRLPALPAFLVEVCAQHPAAVRIILTGYPDLSCVVQAVNEAKPFHMLTKPWSDDELAQVVDLAFEQYAVNVKRDRIIDEYAAIRATATRAYAHHILKALMESIRPDMTQAAIDDLPVGALLVSHRRLALANLAARRLLGTEAPTVGDAVEDLAEPSGALVMAALVGPRRRRIVHRFAGSREGVEYFVAELAAGTLIAFTPLQELGRAPASATLPARIGTSDGA